MSVPDERNLCGYHSPHKARRFALHFINYFWRQRLTSIFALNFCKIPFSASLSGGITSTFNRAIGLFCPVVLESSDISLIPVALC